MISEGIPRKDDSEELWAHTYEQSKENSKLHRSILTLCTDIDPGEEGAATIQRMIEVLIQKEPADLDYDIRFSFFYLALYALEGLKDSTRVIDVLHAHKSDGDFIRNIQNVIPEVKRLLQEARETEAGSACDAVSHLLELRGALSYEKLRERSPFDPETDL